jgi:hypothetical protein
MDREYLNSRTLIPPIAWGTVLAIVILALSLEPIHEVFTLIAPLCALIGISVLFFLNQTRKDRRLPIADLGSFYMLAILAYGAIPLAFHLLSGMNLTVLSHVRLYAIDPAPDEFAQVGWMHVFFAFSFACAYLAMRGKHPYGGVVHVHISGTTSKILLVMLLVFQGYVFWVKASTGVDFSAAYNDNSVYEQAEAYQQLSLVQQQLISHPYGMLAAIKMGLIIWLTTNWHRQPFRWTLITVLGTSVLSYLQAPGSRYLLLSMFLAAFLTYHITVRPIRQRAAVMYFALLMIAFFIANIYRLGTEYIDQLGDLSGVVDKFFSVSNEFQAHYGSILDLQDNFTSGTLETLPWQVYLHEVLLIFPHQILPFEKIDPVAWYVAATYPDFFNYGVIAQSVVGFGFAELVLRGIVTGAIFAVIHNWWMRKAGQFWPTFFYIWLLIAVYQSFRNASMYIAPLIIYEWAPVFVLAMLLKAVFSQQYLALAPVSSANVTAVNSTAEPLPSEAGQQGK